MKSFLYLTFEVLSASVCIICLNTFCKNAAFKMLSKLTPGRKSKAIFSFSNNKNGLRGWREGQASQQAQIRDGR
jgi:hypothetical protein